MQTRNQQWIQLRKKGLIHFVFFTGMMKWGLFFYIFFSGIPLLLENKIPSFNLIIKDIIICALTGIASSLLVWYLSEKKFIHDSRMDIDYLEIDPLD
jgi:hypothetical protein